MSHVEATGSDHKKTTGMFLRDVISVYTYIIYMYSYYSTYLVENDLERKNSDKRLLRNLSTRAGGDITRFSLSEAIRTQSL